MDKTRLDVLLVERGLVESRAKAQPLIMAGLVRVDGQVVLKPATPVPTVSHLELEKGPRFVSRGGEKLEAALQAFRIDVQDCICADVGASTGGFSDCLLQHGAGRVYAIDVGKGQLHWKLRNHPRLVVMENTNARFLESLPEPISLAAIDASFISLKNLLPVVKRWFPGPTSHPAGDGHILALIKPQFEAGKKEAGRGEGVIRDPAIHRRILMEILSFSQQQGWGVRGLIKSPLLGPKGNVEFLMWLGMGLDDPITAFIDAILPP